MSKTHQKKEYIRRRAAEGGMSLAAYRQSLKDAEEQRRQNVLKIMDEYNKKKVSRHEQKGKFKTVDEVWTAFKDVVSIDLASQIRPLKDFKNFTYSNESQKRLLINYLYVKYKTPEFLYKVFEGDNVNRHYLDWFLTVAQGGSLRKITKDIFTAKEAHLFLSAPTENTIAQNVWWTKCKSIGMKDGFIKKLVNKMFKTSHPTAETIASKADMLFFFERYQNRIDDDLMSDICDCILGGGVNGFKGRTLSSVINLSNAWHRQVVTSKNVGPSRTWDGFGGKSWFRDFSNGESVEIVELRNTESLQREGEEQRHCVGSYSTRCASGSSWIFSMRWYAPDLHEFKQYRVTIEIASSDRRLVQARCKRNQSIVDEHRTVIKEWAGSKGFLYK